MPKITTKITPRTQATLLAFIIILFSLLHMPASGFSQVKQDPFQHSALSESVGVSPSVPAPSVPAPSVPAPSVLAPSVLAPSVLAPSVLGSNHILYKNPYLGIITGDRVRIRTGDSLNHFSFARAGLGQKVVVVGEKGDWRQIQVPDWAPLYVHNSYITKTEKILIAVPQTGTVSADTLVVRVRPERKHEAVGTIPYGTCLEILGTAGDGWLKIVPPQGTYCWIFKSYIAKEKDLAPGQVVNKRSFPTESITSVSITNRNQNLNKNLNRKQEIVNKQLKLRVPADITVQKAWDLLKVTLKHKEKQKENGLINYEIIKASFQKALSKTTNPSEIGRGKEALRLVAFLQDRQKKIHSAKEVLAKANLEERELKRKYHVGEIPVNSKGLRDSQSKNSTLKFIGNDNKLQTGNSDPFIARGWVTGIGHNLGRIGTHRLTKGGQVLLYLKNGKGLDKPLDFYRNKRVEVKGAVENINPSYGANLLVVSEVVILSEKRP